MGMKSNGGENLVEVHGGHLVPSTGRKDRHSKIFTAKGPRDRRVRLSAHTAIQFYDVQDRLGYDRPSKAVDWLINKAKSAIDKLAQLPPSLPNPTHQIAIQEEHSESPGYNAASAINFQGYPHDMIISTLPDSAQHLDLSLQSFQNPRLLNPNSQENTTRISSTYQTRVSGSAPVGYDSNFQRSMMGWSTSPLQDSQQAMFGQGLTFSQGGTRQSSFLQSARVWDDVPIGSAIVGTRFVSDGLPALHFPFRIHGEEENSVVSDISSPYPPDSNH